MIGIGIEPDHLNKYRSGLRLRRMSCLAVPRGLFAGAGLLGLSTVAVARGLYLIALHAQRQRREENNASREMMEASHLYSSPVISHV